MFEKVTRKKAKLRLALTGVSGAGKTLSALYIAYGITKVGLPDEHREWKLDAKKKKTRKTEQSDFKIKSCTRCFKVFSSFNSDGTPVRICPFCGFELVKDTQKKIEEVQAVLHKVEGFVLNYESPDDCSSYQELLAYASRKGYKRGWAYYQAKRRGMI